MTHAEFTAEHGSDPADLAKVEAFANSLGLKVVESSSARRSVMLSGRAKDMADAFGVKLERDHHPKFTYRGRTGEIHVPKDLSGIVAGVFGLDDRPRATASRFAVIVHAHARSMRARTI